MGSCSLGVYFVLQDEKLLTSFAQGCDYLTLINYSFKMINFVLPHF